MKRLAYLARAGCLALGLALLGSVGSPLAGAIKPFASAPSVVDVAHQQDVLVGDDGTIRLVANAPPAPAAFGPFERYGLTISPTYRYSFPFRELRVDYRAVTPAGSVAYVDARASTDGARWTAWETGLAPGERALFVIPARYAQYRVTLLSNRGDPLVSSLTLAPAFETTPTAYAGEQPVAPTYRIRATRQGMVGGRTASGHRIQKRDRYVSLPSRRVTSKAKNPEYWVRISYNGRSSTVPVLDVGPWNIHDNYWDAKREWWDDLPRGYPQDHAAYFDGYNKGVAEKGRVSHPTAMDVGDGAWWDDLGIKGDQAWVEVTFLWLGVDPQGPAPPTPPAPPAEAAPPAATEAPQADQVHVHNNDPAFESHAAREWYEKKKCGASGRALWTYTTNNSAESENYARWKPGLPAEAQYDVYVLVPKCSVKAPNTTSARYVVNHRDGSNEVVVDQGANRGKWVHLGRFPFAAGDAGFVELHDITGDAMQTIWFDAAKWIRVP